jgi:Ecdysteroid kinase-like family
MIHGDFRLDNILLAISSNELLVVDWQTISYGAVLGDVAYFLGCALPIDVRRAHHDELIATYHSALTTGTPLSPDRCHKDLRRQSFFGVVIGIASPMLVKQTERGDEMFATIMRRHCTLVLDLDALATLPGPTILRPL